MSRYLTISIELLNGAFHGRGEGDEPEWPPSPLRLFQALVAAQAIKSLHDPTAADAREALFWLEEISPPLIIAPRACTAAPLRLAVPNNDLDVVAAAWVKGQEPQKQPSELKTMKSVRPTRLIGGNALHYLWEGGDRGGDRLAAIVARLQTVARSVTHLGWGIDMAAAHVRLLSADEAAALPGERWLPSAAPSPLRLRVPLRGTLHDLLHRHQQFLARIQRDQRGYEFFQPVPPLKTFQLVYYRRQTDSLPPPYALFRLQSLDVDRAFSYPQSKFIHIAGMVRHLAIHTLRRSPPPRTDDHWLESYVAGHAHKARPEHRQFSYLPLPSIGHPHVNPSIRRVLIVAPPGDDAWLQHLALRLNGQVLQPTPQTQLPSPPALERITPDSVALRYLQPAAEWHSVTPVILPGHDDHKPAKTRKLIEKALRQSGIELPCEFEWSPFSRFPKSFSAHKYSREGGPAGYLRPDHLISNTAVHLTIRFPDGIKPSGPLVLGAGRHCGFGLMASCDSA